MKKLALLSALVIGGLFGKTASAQTAINLRFHQHTQSAYERAAESRLYRENVPVNYRFNDRRYELRSHRPFENNRFNRRGYEGYGRGHEQYDNRYRDAYANRDNYRHFDNQNELRAPMREQGQHFDERRNYAQPNHAQGNYSRPSNQNRGEASHAQPSYGRENRSNAGGQSHLS